MKLFFTIIFLPLSILGQSSDRHLTGKYAGWWADSYWTYVFDGTNSYQFQTAGHFGITKTVGHYLVSKDTIFLTPLPKDQQPDNKYMPRVDTLLKDGDSCIISLAVGFDYRKAKRNSSKIYISRQRIKSIETLKEEEN